MQSSPFDLTNKVILITGASSGIGKTIALECVKMGAKVIITARNKERLEATLSVFSSDSGVLHVADITVEEDRQTLVNSLPQLDGIVHCAGITDPVLFQFISGDRLKSIFDVNFFSPILLTKEALKGKKIKKNCSIIFISSISGVLCSSIGGSMYSATKAALSGMTKGIALDLAPKRVRVNTICPGMIDTGIFDDSSITKEQLEEDKKRYPLGRYGKPEDVSYAAIYLLSDASQWVTGSNLIIDGGYTLL